MRTNLEKWNHYMDILLEKAEVFMDTISKEKPSVFYNIEPSGKVRECFILKRYYSFRLHFYGKKPTRKDVDKIKEFFESDLSFEKRKAYFEYEYTWGDGHKAKTSIKMEDVFSGERVFFSKEEAEEKGLIIQTKKAEEKSFKETHKKDVDYNYNSNGYKFLGWQNGWKHVYFDEDGNLCSETGKPKQTFGYLKEDYPQYVKCRDAGHIVIEVSHNRRGSENTVSCPLCMIYWKYDCSD